MMMITIIEFQNKNINRLYQLCNEKILSIYLSHGKFLLTLNLLQDHGSPVFCHLPLYSMLHSCLHPVDSKACTFALVLIDKVRTHTEQLQQIPKLRMKIIEPLLWTIT